MGDIIQHFLRSSGPVLCLDIGSGTQDATLARPNMEIENWPHFVLPSPARAVSQRIRELTLLKRDVWLYGSNMGGGFTSAVQSCIGSGRRVFATCSASKAINNNEEAVQRLGVCISSRCPEGCVPVHLGDFSPSFWDGILRVCGLPQPHLVLAAAQDHGENKNNANRCARMGRLTSLLTSNPNPMNWIFNEPASELTRLVALHEKTGGPVADTATAALLGALVDPSVQERSLRQGITIVNVGNSHIFAALVYRGLVRGVYEHHTGMRTRDELLDDLREFRHCFLPLEKVQESGGHGTAYGPSCEEAGGYEPTFILGPQRSLLLGYGQFIAPNGEMMLAGALGLLWGYSCLHRMA